LENKAAVTPRKRGNLIVTGSLGKVMKESIQIAYTYAKYLCHTFYDSNFLEENDVHIHFPDGASKKDGPSAGVTITTSLLSLALN
jgi:ATP-dependent Lon protease